MKRFLLNACTLLLFIGFLGVCLWVCLNPWILIVLFLIASALGLILAGLANILSPPPPRQPPPSARQPDTLTPLLLGLALGWWLGSGPDDGGSG